MTQRTIAAKGMAASSSSSAQDYVLCNRTPESAIREEYSDPARIREYCKVGLWLAEDRLVTKYFHPGGSVLDLGCGAGRTTIDLAKRGFEVTGIDIVDEILKAARSQVAAHNAKVSLFLMDASALGFPDQSFEQALFSFNGFEQIPGRERRKRVIREIYRVLKPGGVLILTARSGIAFGRRWLAWIWMSLRYCLQKLFGYGKVSLDFGDMVSSYSYHHYMSPFSVRRQLRDEGFTVLEFNSKRNIECRRRSSFVTNFSRDKSLFYVVRKPAQESGESEK